jgi:hypothetical protein
MEPAGNSPLCDTGEREPVSNAQQRNLITIRRGNMRENVTRLFLFVLCVVALFACASAPHKTSLQLDPEPGKLTLGQQDLDHAFNTAVATGLDLGYRVVSSSKEQRVVSLNRFRMADMVSETMNVDIENKGATADVTIIYESPRPLADAAVKEFTDRFLARLKTQPSARPSAPVSTPSTPGMLRVEPGSRDASTDKAGETYLILLKNSNIRTEPTTKSKILTTLRKGEKVIKIDESGKWFNVRLPSGETGWLLKSLAKEAE